MTPLPLALAIQAHLLFALVAGMIYALAALSLKAASGAIRPLRITLLSNIVTAAAFIGFIDFSARPLFPSSAWGPAAALAACFLFGQIFAIVALAWTDVSIATPILSSKAVFVAFLLAAFFHHPIGPAVWLAAMLTMLGVGLLQATDEPRPIHHIGRTILLSVLGALGFAGYDVFTQVFSRTHGFARVVPLGMLLAAIPSLALLPFSNRAAPRPAPRAWIYLALGILLLTLQSLILIRAIGLYGDAASMNIVYGARGLWSFVLVWLLGHWFQNTELHLRRRTLLLRLAGALAILAAIALVLRK